VNRRAIVVSYMQSLLWIALFVALTTSVALIAELIFFDLIHGNPHRTLRGVIAMAVFQTPLIAGIVTIESFMVFTLPQLFQVAAIVALNQMLGSRARLIVPVLLPITAVLTWYCYDYLTPSIPPYEHGISGLGYLAALASQTAVTAFSALYFEARIGGRTKKPVLAAAVAIVLLAGGIWGYRMSQDQIQLQTATPPDQRG